MPEFQRTNSSDTAVNQVQDAVEQLEADLSEDIAAVSAVAEAKTDDSYTPTVPGDWATAPTTIQDALDMIAAKIRPLHGAV